MRIIPRAEWGARHPNGFGQRRLPAREAWLHHSVTIAPDLLAPFDDDYAAIRTLEQIGQDRFGGGISYTRLITPAGLVFEGHSVDRVGSHTADHNSIACGYCLVGDYSATRPTDVQLRALAWVLQHDHGHGWIDQPRLDGGHRDLKATSCPGDRAYTAIPAINRLAAGPPIQEDTLASSDQILAELRGYGARIERIDVGAMGGWGYGRRIEHTEAMVAQLLAALADGDLDPEAVLARVDTAVGAATEQAITTAVIPALRATLTELLDEDNAGLADQILTRLAERLRPVA